MNKCAEKKEYSPGDIVMSTDQEFHPHSADTVGIVTSLAPTQQGKEFVGPDAQFYLVIEWQLRDNPEDSWLETFTTHLSIITKRSLEEHGPINPPEYKATVEQRAAKIMEEQR